MIHISSHGELGSILEAKMGRVHYQAYPNKGNFLLFEDILGNSFPLSVNDLRDMMKKQKMPGSQTQCVFLAACYSQEHGEVLFEAGIPHVICT